MTPRLRPAGCGPATPGVRNDVALHA